MKFSIITVCFNSEKTIERTIRSVLNQTFSDYEYIIVDGCSKDNTLDIVKRYEPDFNGCLRWISEPDSGIYDAMNKGIKMARGEIVGIVNSDDWLEPDVLEVINESAKDTVEDRIYTGDIRYYYVNGEVQVISYNHTKLKRCSKLYLIGVNHPATFVPRSCYEKYGTFDTNLKIMADGDLITRLYYNNVPFVFIPKVLSNQMDGGASQTYLNKTLQDYKYVLSKNVSNKFVWWYLYLFFYSRITVRRFSPTWLKKIHRR